VRSLAEEENDLASRVAESERIEIEDAQLIVLTRKLWDILVTNDKKLVLVAKAHGVNALDCDACATICKKGKAR